MIRPHPRILVGIVTFRSGDSIAPCLESLRAGTVTPARTIVWENSGERETLAAIRNRFPEVLTHLSDENCGFGRGHNGVLNLAAQCGGPEWDYYLCLNPDVLLAPRFLEEMVEAIEKTPRAGSANGLVCFLRNGERTDEIYSRGHLLYQDRRIEDLHIYRRVDTTSSQDAENLFGPNGACCLLRRSAMEEVLLEGGSLFEPRFFLYGEDDDLGWRLQLRGWKCIHAEKARAWHAAGSSTRLIPGTARREAIANRWLMILANDRPLLFVRHLHWILSVEFLATAGYTLKQPSYLLRYCTAWAKVIRFALPMLKRRRYLRRTWGGDPFSNQPPLSPSSLQRVLWMLKRRRSKGAADRNELTASGEGALPPPPTFQNRSRG